ncbi:MAG: VirB3 family type IV secretion system protein [Terriglobales bacterium]|jgi:type IV secretory pathway TrbD component
MRTNRVYKVMNRPLTILGAERRLFFVALLAGAGIFNLVHSLVGGVLLFVVGLIAAQRATKFDPEILRILLNSAKFKSRYDPMKWEPLEIRIKSNV